jgi:hypothetical protein
LKIARVRIVAVVEAAVEFDRAKLELQPPPPPVAILFLLFLECKK